jgi:hypothetical protein
MKHLPARSMTRGLVTAAVLSLVLWRGDHVSEGAPAPAKPAATRPAEVYSAWPFDAKEAARRQAETAAALGVPKEVSLDLGKRVTLKLAIVEVLNRFGRIDPDALARRFAERFAADPDRGYGKGARIAGPQNKSRPLSATSFRGAGDEATRQRRSLHPRRA